MDLDVPIRRNARHLPVLFCPRGRRADKLCSQLLVLPKSAAFIPALLDESECAAAHYGRVRALSFFPLDIPHDSLIRSSI
jgi:hypothetical protein